MYVFAFLIFLGKDTLCFCYILLKKIKQIYFYNNFKINPCNFKYKDNISFLYSIDSVEVNGTRPSKVSRLTSC
jgi:hypothetical protein